MCHLLNKSTIRRRAARQTVAAVTRAEVQGALVPPLRGLGAVVRKLFGPMRKVRKPDAAARPNGQAHGDRRAFAHRFGRLQQVLIRLAAVVGTVVLSAPASAFVTYKAASCSPGQRWDTSRPVKVRLLAPSYFDYLEKFKARGGTTGLADLARIDRDIKAVIELYNAIPGSSLVLEHDTGLVSDSNLDEPDQDNFGTQTIVIGFTDGVAKGSSTAEAWAPGDSQDGCTRTRAHILFRKDFNWTFGPPDTTDVDGRHFSTAEQPRLKNPADPTKTVKPRSFLGILTHEMGHAVGLGHPDNNYAVMAQGFRTWFRGPDHVLRTRLLPDDTAGILALYGKSAARTHVDVSVTNSWYKSAEAQYSSCSAEIAQVNAAARAISKATGLPVDGQFPAGVIIKGEHAGLFAELERAQDALRGCEDRKNAMQVDNCRVSSRGDTWAGQLTGVDAFCGVNDRTGSAHATVSEKVCPGRQVQLRYTLNNHSMYRDALVKSEVWFSRDTALNARDGSDVQSPDIREVTIKSGASANIGQVFRLPASASKGSTLYVFVRAVPYDPQTGASLWSSDADQWNNAIMVRKSITVDPGPCQ